MVYKQKKAKLNWRQFVTKEERGFLEDYATRKHILQCEIDDRTPEFIRIRNRAMKRAEYKHRSKT